ncbi:hypothetical protein [Ulvibacterium sp.]|uniref:hypothetical protein n=1 Tax=Ulvibacterium sp. TaxID=2665914 RepID=UPI003BA932CC
MERKIDWGNSKYWTQTDFESLSERILEETGRSLSPSTLKRLWGRVKYTNMPQTATLDTLANFIGYPSYRDFERECRGSDSKRGVPISAQDPVPKGNTSRKGKLAKGGLLWIGSMTGFLISLSLAFHLSQRKEDGMVVDSSQYSFSSRPVSTGIPNSVVFTFDVSLARTDCLQIQQSWDERLRFSIERDQRQATSIYYYPGLFQAKLMVDNVVVKEHLLHIGTDGWLPLVERMPVPVYFTPEESINDGVLGLSVEQLMDRNISLQPEVPKVNYYYVGEMGGLSGHDFTLETSLKNTFATGSGACQNSHLAILFENSAIAIPLSIPGCTSAINAFVAGKSMEGGKTDLSALGVDFTQWVKLRLMVKDKRVQLFIDGQPVLQTVFSLDTGKIIGVVYRFQGTGSVDYLRLYDRDGALRFREEF